MAIYSITLISLFLVVAQIFFSTSAVASVFAKSCSIKKSTLVLIFAKLQLTMRAFLQNSELVTANVLTPTGLIVTNEEIPLSFADLAGAEEVGALLIVPVNTLL